MATTEDGEHGDKRLLHAVDKHALHAGDVVDHAGHDVAGRARIIPAQRQALEGEIEIAPQVEDDFLLEGVVDADAQRAERVLRQERHDDNQHIRQQEIGALGDQDVVDHEAGDFRENETGQRARDAGAERAEAQAGISAGIFPNAAESFHRSR